MKRIIITIVFLIVLAPNSMLAAPDATVATGPSIRILNPLTTEVKEEFLPFPQSSTIMGLSVATADLNGDSKYEIIAGAGANEKPLVRIFDNLGEIQSEFLAYAEDFTAGVRVAAANLSSDKAAIITAPNKSGDSQIRVFDPKGKLLSSFYAFNEKLMGGASVGSGDVNGDGQNEIIVGSGYNMAPIVKVFSYSGQFLKQISVFSDKFESGVNVLAVDLNNDGKDEIITSPQMDLGPEVRVYNFNGDLLNTFLAYQSNFKGGVNLASGDVDNDSKPEIITGAGATGGAHIRIYDSQGQNILNPKFFAYPDFKGGISVAAADLDSDGMVEVVAAMQNYFPNDNRANRRIEVDISKQTVYAYSKDTLEREFTVSTGKWQFPTPLGTYKILTKLLKTTMAGYYGMGDPNNYYLPNVPHVMYFYRNYAIHGAYWHWKFGTRVSHGCINLKLDDAAWLYDWADIGTPVIIYASKK